MTKLTIKDPQITSGCQIRCFTGSWYDNTHMYMYHIADGVDITM